MITDVFDPMAEASSFDGLPIAEIVFQSESIVPCNIVVSAVGHCYLSVNPLLQPTIKLFRVTGDSLAIPYPNEAYAVGPESQLGGVLGIKMDHAKNLWMLDMVKNQFVVWNTLSETLERIIPIPPQVTLPNSYMHDFVIDEKNKRIIIADMTLSDQLYKANPAFIVMDMLTGNMVRMAQNYSALCAEPDGLFGLNPITIDPLFEWVYFGAIHSHTLYRVAADSFVDEDQLIADIMEFSYKPYCDGIVADQYENVYIANVEQNALSVCNRDGLHHLALLPAKQVWPNGLCLTSGFELYCAVSQMSRLPALNHGENLMRPPYVVVKIPIDVKQFMRSM